MDRSKTNPLSIRTGVRKKVPAVALAAPGHSRLGDEDGFSCQWAWHSVVLLDTLRRP